MQNIWRPSVGKIGKYIFFERLQNLFVKICSLCCQQQVFWGSKLGESSFLPLNSSLDESSCSASCRHVSNVLIRFLNLGSQTRREGCKQSSMNWFVPHSLQFKSQKVEVPQNISYCTSFNLLGGCEQMGSSLLLQGWQWQLGGLCLCLHCDELNIRSRIEVFGLSPSDFGDPEESVSCPLSLSLEEVDSSDTLFPSSVSCIRFITCRGGLVKVYEDE